MRKILIICALLMLGGIANAYNLSSPPYSQTSGTASKLTSYVYPEQASGSTLNQFVNMFTANTSNKPVYLTKTSTYDLANTTANKLVVPTGSIIYGNGAAFTGFLDCRDGVKIYDLVYNVNTPYPTVTFPVNSSINSFEMSGVIVNNTYSGIMIPTQSAFVYFYDAYFKNIKITNCILTSANNTMGLAKVYIEYPDMLDSFTVKDCKGYGGYQSTVARIGIETTGQNTMSGKNIFIDNFDTQDVPCPVSIAGSRSGSMDGLSNIVIKNCDADYPTALHTSSAKIVYELSGNDLLAQGNTIRGVSSNVTCFGIANSAGRYNDNIQILDNRTIGWVDGGFISASGVNNLKISGNKSYSVTGITLGSSAAQSTVNNTIIFNNEVICSSNQGASTAIPLFYTSNANSKVFGSIVDDNDFQCFTGGYRPIWINEAGSVGVIIILIIIID